MVEKCYKDTDGNVICSDSVLFEEYPENIIDEVYIKDVYYRDPQEVYIEILEENKHINKQLFKGSF